MTLSLSPNCGRSDHHEIASGAGNEVSGVCEAAKRCAVSARVDTLEARADGVVTSKAFAVLGRVRGELVSPGIGAKGVLKTLGKMGRRVSSRSMLGARAWPLWNGEPARGVPG